ncbi:aldo/keto reductase [Ectobacillus ponti]|uniref:Aldo/keto reductase n=1 Tax=Ectobacillus ponti TaxID=2961894 RepID=A0AA41X7L7_9BACI|nr:aldo/keto reductase [Ectobacillus ponti]MCP8970394.1 aldo/keto reductase [Ectobacillus ponti]
MKQTPLQKRGIAADRIVLGCMGLGGTWDNSPETNEQVLEAERAIDAALESGIRMFDHADIYKMGKAEIVFGQALKNRPYIREQLVIQSKCGIRFAEGEMPGRYDFSKEHILSSVDGILSRLGMEYLDILLLHRPDPLMEPEEVAEAFAKLKESGKVRHFGVSNMNASQIKLLQHYLPDPLVVNQLQMNLHHIGWLEEGVLVNQQAGTSFSFPESLLAHCQLENIQIQAWAPLAGGLYSGRELSGQPESVLQTKKLVHRMAAEKETSAEAIVLGWLMRHPAMIQPVIGTTKPERIRSSVDAIRIAEQMTREEWYSLYVASRGRKMP